MFKATRLALAVLIAVATPAWAEGSAATRDASPSSRKSVQSGTPSSGFTIDQKGVKRTTDAPASGFAIDQKRVKGTLAPATSGAGAAAEKSGKPAPQDAAPNPSSSIFKN